MGDRQQQARPDSLNRRQGVGAVAIAFAVAFAVTGCGNMIYAVNVNAAANKIEEAKQLGAEQWAPYEYYYAKEHILKAQSEAAEADYGDAAELASISEEYAIKAIRIAKATRGAAK
jgi:hypothetical protein